MGAGLSPPAPGLEDSAPAEARVGAAGGPPEGSLLAQNMLLLHLDMLRRGIIVIGSRLWLLLLLKLHIL